MATQAYWNWVSAGRPFRRPPWLTELKALAHVHGVPFLGDLGNEEHLKSDFPEDHTPFSATEWPVAIDGWVINAIDLGDGPWSDRILADARAGRLPWLKYLNFRYRNYSRKRGFAPVSNSDLHLHISGMSDHTWYGLNGYNPFVVPAPPPPTSAPQEEEDDMATLYHVIDDASTPDRAVFAYVSGGNCRVAVGPTQTLANKIATPPAAPDKGTGNSSGLSKTEWNELMVWMGVPGNRFDADGIFHPEPA